MAAIASPKESIRRRSSACISIASHIVSPKMPTGTCLLQRSHAQRVNSKRQDGLLRPAREKSRSRSMGLDPIVSGLASQPPIRFGARASRPTALNIARKGRRPAPGQPAGDTRRHAREQARAGSQNLKLGTVGHGHSPSLEPRLDDISPSQSAPTLGNEPGPEAKRSLSSVKVDPRISNRVQAQVN